MAGVCWTGTPESLGEISRFGLSIQAEEGNRCGKPLLVYPYEALAHTDPWKSQEAVTMAIGDAALRNGDGTFTILTPEELYHPGSDYLP